ncbi:MAG: UDP-2,3-diacylglucosamine diphosphatase [Saprospiraceae bacterium]|nr:UDP-2,3-diacylglucosamine diphosphatase [Saprospiraceae bacterium]
MSNSSKTLGKIYFASDFHLGADAILKSADREKLICNWLDEISLDAGQVWLVGDLFDFWFEYNKAIPKGFARFLSRLVILKEKGIDVQVFTGNHDLWMKDYFYSELGIPVHHHPVQINLSGKKFYLAHGDGLGPGDLGFKLMKKVFKNSFSIFLYRWLHPDLGIPLANYFSGKSRNAQTMLKEYLGRENEWLIQYVERKSLMLDIDYYIFGHRHLPIDYKLKNQTSRYINLGDWLVHQSYAVFDGQELELKFYRNENGKIYS